MPLCPLLALLFAVLSVLVSSSHATAPGSSHERSWPTAVVANEMELLRAIQRQEVTDIVFAGPIKMGSAWRKLKRPLQLTRSITLRSNAPSISQSVLWDLAFMPLRVELAPNVTVRLHRLEILRVTTVNFVEGAVIRIVELFDGEGMLELDEVVTHALICTKKFMATVAQTMRRPAGDPGEQRFQSVDQPFCLGRNHRCYVPHGRAEDIYFSAMSLKMAGPNSESPVQVVALDDQMPVHYTNSVFICEVQTAESCLKGMGLEKCVASQRLTVMRQLVAEGVLTSADLGGLPPALVMLVMSTSGWALAGTAAAILATVYARWRWRKRASSSSNNGSELGEEEREVEREEANAGSIPPLSSHTPSAVHSCSSTAHPQQHQRQQQQGLDSLYFDAPAARGVAEALDQARGSATRACQVFNSGGSGGGDGSTQRGDSSTPRNSSQLLGRTGSSGDKGGLGAISTASLPIVSGRNLEGSGTGSKSPGRRGSGQGQGQGYPLERISTRSISNSNLDSRTRVSQAIQQLADELAPRGAGVGEQRLVLGKLLGRGATGSVYQGRWRTLDVAVKVIQFDSGTLDLPDAGSEVKAITEAAVAMSVEHENVVATWGYEVRPLVATGAGPGQHSSGIDIEDSTQGWRLYLIEELCQMSLTEALDRGLMHDKATGQPELVSVIKLLLDIARGMSYIHSKNIIHGDLKPNNVLLKIDGEGRMGVTAKIIDFGLAKLLQDPTKSYVSNALQGTPFYIAPEVLSARILTRASDCFSFGVLAFEVYAGLKPYRALADGGFELNPEYQGQLLQDTSRLSSLVRRCLSVAPKERPTFEDMVRVLDTELSLLLAQRC